MQKLSKRKHTKKCLKQLFVWNFPKSLQSGTFIVPCSVPFTYSVNLTQAVRASSLNLWPSEACLQAFAMAWAAPGAVSREFPPLLPQPEWVPKTAWDRAVKSPPPSPCCRTRSEVVFYVLRLYMGLWRGWKFARDYQPLLDFPFLTHHPLLGAFLYNRTLISQMREWRHTKVTLLGSHTRIPASRCPVLEGAPVSKSSLSISPSCL